MNTKGVDTDHADCDLDHSALAESIVSTTLQFTPGCKDILREYMFYVAKYYVIVRDLVTVHSSNLLWNSSDNLWLTSAIPRRTNVSE